MESFPARGAVHSVEEVRSGLVIAVRIKRAVAYSDSVLGGPGHDMPRREGPAWDARLAPVRPVC